MTKTPILLAGAGGHARACIDVLEQEGRYAVHGLVGLPPEIGTTILTYAVVGSDADFAELLSHCRNALVTVGQIKSAEPRMRLFRLLEQAGYALPSIVSPHAYVSRHAKIGAGTIVMHGAVVNAGAVVGCNCIINSQALVEHDTVVGDHCHVSTSAAVNSGVTIGAGTFVGSGASVRQTITIGERCVIGMGQRVLRDCAPGTWLPPVGRSR